MPLLQDWRMPDAAMIGAVILAAVVIATVPDP